MQAKRSFPFDFSAVLLIASSFAGLPRRVALMVDIMQRSSNYGELLFSPSLLSGVNVFTFSLDNKRVLALCSQKCAFTEHLFSPLFIYLWYLLTNMNSLHVYIVSICTAVYYFPSSIFDVYVIYSVCFSQ